MTETHTDAEAITQEYEDLYIVYRYWMKAGWQYQIYAKDGKSHGFFITLEKAKEAARVIKKNGWYR